jgi:hypothetical protein
VIAPFSTRRLLEEALDAFLEGASVGLLNRGDGCGYLFL